MPEVPQWARVQGNMNCHVRRGAWYEVLRLAADEALLAVDNRAFRVPRSSLQIVPVRPQRWSVVARPSDAVMVPLSWGSQYAVCPGCRDRTPLMEHPTEIRCPRCDGVYAVAWDGHY
jgi:hypothetical protein